MLGAIVGVVGALQATEVLKEVLGIGDSLAGRLLIYDGRGGRFETVNVAWDPENPLSGRHATIRDLSIHSGPGPEACAGGSWRSACESHG